MRKGNTRRVYRLPFQQNRNRAEKYAMYQQALGNRAFIGTYDGGFGYFVEVSA
jgi:hypothetical protein